MSGLTSTEFVNMMWLLVWATASRPAFAGVDHAETHIAHDKESVRADHRAVGGPDLAPGDRRRHWCRQRLLHSARPPRGSGDVRCRFRTGRSGAGADAGRLCRWDAVPRATWRPYRSQT